MKILKNYLALIVCFVMLVPGMSVKVDARPSDPEPTITEIKSASDMKGCYYDGTETPDNTSDDVWNEDPCFKDATLSDIVFDTLVDFYRDNADDPTLKMEVNEEGELHTKDGDPYPIRKVLNDFRGNIKAKSKGITSIKGIQFLTHAKEIELRNNKITDFSELNVGADQTMKNDYYGYGPNEDPDDLDYGFSRDVVWKLGGNPFTRLPYALGGRLVIEATQTTSSPYDVEDEEFVFFRNTDEKFSGELDIFRCEIMETDPEGNLILGVDNKPTYRKVNISTINFVKTIIDEEHIKDVDDTGIKIDKSQGDIDPKTGLHKGFTSEKLYFIDLQTSRRQRIGIGADQEIHYMTADEFDTKTPGSQSFKYYIDPKFKVYDSVKLKGSEKTAIKLHKTDKDTGLGLPGAKFEIRDEQDNVVKTPISDKDGDVIIDDLPVGKYTIKEIEAPKGYELSNDVTATFEIKTHQLGDLMEISGGESTVTEINGTATTGTTHTAGTNEVYIAGNFTPNDIVLNPKSGETVTNVIVTYTKYSEDGTEITGNYSKTFDTTQAAAGDINAKRKAGHIYGSVNVVAYLADQVIDLGTFENTKTPPTPPDEPGIPGRPGKPTEPTEPEEPLIPLVPAEPIEPETPTTPEVPTVPVTPTSPKVPNTSTESLKDVWGVLMGLSFIAIVGIVIKARKEN